LEDDFEQRDKDIETAAEGICMICNSSRSTWSEVLDALTGTVFNDREVQEIRDYLDYLK